MAQFDEGYKLEILQTWLHKFTLPHYMCDEERLENPENAHWKQPTYLTSIFNIVYVSRDAHECKRKAALSGKLIAK